MLQREPDSGSACRDDSGAGGPVILRPERSAESAAQVLEDMRATSLRTISARVGFDLADDDC